MSPHETFFFEGFPLFMYLGDDIPVKEGGSRLADIKSRAIKHEVYLIADGDPSRAFITMNLAILSGRSDEVKAHMARAVRELLERSFSRTLAENAA